jgi:hypothetical protein
MATTLFTFDMRPRGSATGNEEINIQKWSVRYFGGNLHVDNPVGDIYIFTPMGILVKHLPNMTDIPVYLQANNIYLVHSGKYTAKLFVGKEGAGSATATTQVQTKSMTYTYDNIFDLRSGNGEKIEYWNIANGKMTIPIDLLQVKSFKFVPDANMSLEYKNGRTVEITNYMGGTYDAEPEQNDSYWNMEESILCGGVSYTMDLTIGGVWDIVAVACTNDNIIGRSVSGKVNESMSKSKIVQPDFMSSRLGWAYKDDGVYVLSRFAPISVGGVDWIGYYYYDNPKVTPGEAHLRTRTRVFNFNGGTPEIPFTARIEGYNLVYEFVDVVSGEPMEIWLTP